MDIHSWDGPLVNGPTNIKDAPLPLTGAERAAALAPFTEDEVATAQANWEAGYRQGYQDRSIGCPSAV